MRRAMYHRRFGAAPSPEVMQTAQNAADFLTKLAIGDQVPNYAIKSGATYNKIVSHIQSEFGNPKSISDADALIAKAQRWIAEADAKIAAGTSVAPNQTYRQMLTDLIYLYEEYKVSGTPPLPGGQLPFSPGSAGGSVPSINLGSGNSGGGGYPPSPAPIKAGFSTMSMVAVAALALMMLNSKSRR